MKVQFDKTYPMPGSAPVAWALLQDLEAVAGCMPGAKLTERVGEQHFKGTVSVKFGPASMAFRGEVELKEVDAASMTLKLIGKGTDTTGSSGAAMDLTARIEALDVVSCQLIGSSEVSMSGKAAAFGGRMLGSVADQVLKQFAANFAAQVQARQALAPAAAAATSAQAAAPAAAAPTPSAPMPPASTADTQLNAFALAWAVFKDWLKSLFAPKRA